MPPKKVATTAKAAPKTKPSAPKSKASSAKAASTTTKSAPKRKAAEVQEDTEKPAAKRTKTSEAPEVPKPAPAKTKTAKAAPVKKAVASKKTPEVDESAPAGKVVKKSATTKKTITKDEEPIKKPAVKKAASKRAATEDEEPVQQEPVTKKAPGYKIAGAPKVSAAVKKPAATRTKKGLAEINTPPTQKLQIFVFGEGSAGELGLGAKSADGKKVIDVTRPRLNDRLEALGVVQIAVGGMHCAALTADNKIYTWGVNDAGALGRLTAQEGKMKEVNANSDESDSDSDSDDDDSGLNPAEAEPREVESEHFEEDTKFAAVYASDSATFALTTTGLVYGWGTFRANDGVLGFSVRVKQQDTPALIPELKNIKDISTGTNHALALTHKGKVFAWGAGEQSQLARRVVARTATGALIPREFGLQRKSIVSVATGDYHSFATDTSGKVYAWGLNTFGQTGIVKEDEADDTVHNPTIVENLVGKNIKQLAGGAHHTLSCTKEGEVLIWGRVDNYEGGMKVEDMPKDKLYHDATGKARYLQEPLTIPNIKGSFVASGPDTCLVITPAGKAYSWGFSTNYQTGQGTDQDVAVAAQIDNTAVRGKHLISGGIGGQFGILAADGDVKLNGVKNT